MAGHRRATRKAPSLAYAGHALMENRNGLGVDCTAEPGHWHSPSAKRGFAMRTRASASQDPGRGQAHTTTPNSSRACRAQGVSPPVAQNTKRRGGSAIDARTTRHAGYAISQPIRKRIEPLFGDGKQHRGVLRQLKVRGLKKAHFIFALSLSATNLVRMAKWIFPPNPPLASTG